MNRGDLYRVSHPGSNDPKRYRVFVIVSRGILIESKFTTLICAPVYTKYDGLSTQVPVGIDEGLKHDSSIHCDELVSLPKSKLTNFIGTLSAEKIDELNEALKAALDIP
ncbi:MAG: type II toxin-antitoxin system PemK/MazF family toxin [Calditrichaceae bacterium]|nr:type II toxin-antitoxin system PemK/MazF family toxin [Calditrichaceae bacterium]MBN2708284.1 type II toxin-antitoxin system PemK/MazF family toxin [Calditrichaceae bacterium]RQV91926.1 MAG: type II toxin-antitoxin system PemK/MazF family toxin [Calditrichota bacterium]